MPWKASSVMEERLRFVARLLDGEAMTDVCREFGISRKTGYKIFDRYKEHGLEALSDRSRRPVRYANQLPAQIETLIVQLKAEKPHWGARKIRELLVRRLDGDVRVPAKSTIHAVLDRHGLVRRGGGPRHRRARHVAIARDCPERCLVRRLQRRVQAWQQPLLLPADRQRSCRALPAAVRGARLHARGACHDRLRAPVPRARPAACHSVRQWRAVCQSQCLVQSFQALGMVAPPRYRHRAHQARSSATKWPARAHAPHPQEGGHQAAWLQQPATAGALRCLRARVQYRAPPRGARHEVLPRSTRPQRGPMPACRS